MGVFTLSSSLDGWYNEFREASHMPCHELLVFGVIPEDKLKTVLKRKAQAQFESRWKSYKVYINCKNSGGGCG